MPLPSSVRLVLLDIEGTTTPISFVTEVLFPFARARLASAAVRAKQDVALAKAFAALRREWNEEPAGVAEFGDGAAYAAALMDLDRKSTALKALQGLLWRAGYESGELRASLFPDVAPALARWTQQGVEVAIFSSGSVLAQQLLFRHTEAGDLTPALSAYFDTTTGPKREAASYRAIVAERGSPPPSCLFLSDVVEELDAARLAGLETGLLRRPGNAPAEAGPHPSHESFAELI